MQSIQQAIIKSGNDRRLYKPILLDNKLLCLLIHDPETDKSAAAMNVRVGSVNDPPEVKKIILFY